MPEPETPPEGNPEPETPAAPEQASGETGQQSAEFFSETFDPASLDDALKPAYKQMRDAFSQKTQSLAEQRREAQEALELQAALRDPDKQAEALARLGFDFEGEDDDPQYDDDDPVSQLAREFQEFREAYNQERQTAEQTAQQQALEQAEHAYIVDGLQTLQTKTGREFSEEELDTIGLLSERLRDEEGFPDVDAAYERIYATVLPNERKRWESQKKSPQAPRGSAASEVPDLTTEQGRVDYMAARLAETAD